MRLPPAFAPRLAIAAAAGLAVRVLYVALFARKIAPIGDAVTYHEWARTIAGGVGWVKVAHPELGLQHVAPVPSAEHPPLFPLLLAGLYKLGVASWTAQKLCVCLVGTSTVVFTGLAGRQLAGPRGGLIAGWVAALYPFLWVADGALLAESLYAALMAAALWLALRCWRAPSIQRAALVGATAGLAALARGEALLLVPLLLLPLAWRMRSWRAAAAMLGALALVLAPWAVRNAAHFNDPVLVSTNSNSVFAGSNCGPVYHGDLVGLWSFSCYRGAPPGDESEQAAFYRRQGFDYARDHAGRAVVVAGVRFLRVWDMYRPLQQASYETLEGRKRWASKLGLVFYYPTLMLASAGVLLLRRRRLPWWPPASFALLVSVVGTLVYGITRFRIAAEPALIVLAAVTLETAFVAAGQQRADKRKQRQRDGGHLPVPVEPGVNGEGG